MSGGWNVADGANPERKHSVLDVNQFPPEFGPFDTREEAEAFAAMRPAYYVVPPKTSKVASGLQHEPTCAYHGLAFKTGSANRICSCPGRPAESEDTGAASL